MKATNMFQLIGQESRAIFIRFYCEEKKRYGHKRFNFDDIQMIAYRIEDRKTYITTTSGEQYMSPVLPMDIYEWLPQKSFILYSDSVIVRKHKRTARSIARPSDENA